MSESHAGIHVEVVRVFVDEQGRYGNLLGIVDGSAVPSSDRQRVAAEIGYSETVYVDDAEAGHIAIYTPTIELPFAGHPTVGTAWWLQRQGYDAEQLVVKAGTLDVSREGDVVRVRARSEWAPDFAWQQLGSAKEVDDVDPSRYTAGQHYVWAWIDESAGRVRSRMFAPIMGIVEDQATGAAAIGFTGLQERDLDITQGLGSRISTTWQGDGWATVGGLVVAEASRTLPA